MKKSENAHIPKFGYSQILKFSVLAALNAISVSAVASDVQYSGTHTYDISSGSLDSVINQIAKSAGIQIAIDGSATLGLMSEGLSGEYTLDAALSKVLSKYSLYFEKTPSGFFIKSKERSSSDDIVLSKVTVVASGNSRVVPVTEDTGSYNVNSVTIGKIVSPIKDIPQSVSVMTRQQIEDQDFQTVDQALRQVTGITTNLYGDGTAGYISRGYTLDVQYEGVPASSALQMSPQFDLAMYDRVEVIRGPNGLLQGAGSPSGTVNFARKRPTEDYRFSSSVSIGSNSAYHGELDVGGALNESGTVRGRAVIAGQDRGYATAQKHNDQYMGYAILEADSSPDTTWSFSAAYQDKKTHRFMGIPTYTSSKKLVEATPETYFGANGGYSNYPMKEIVAGVEHRLPDKDWKFNVNVRYKDMVSDLLYGYISSTVSASNTARISLVRSYYEEKNIGVDAYAQGNFDLLGRQHRLLLGFNTERYDYEGGSRTLNLLNQSIYNHDYDLTSVGAVTNKTARRLQQSGLYGASQLSIAESVKATFGARVSNYAYKTRSISPSMGDWKDSSVTTGQVTPYAGMTWGFLPSHNFYISYTDIFTPQDDVYDITNTRLSPKTGWQVESGVKSNFFDNKLNSAISIYRIREKNRAVQDTSNTDCGGAGNDCYSTAGLVQSQGVDIEVLGQLSSAWNISAGYSYNDNRYLRDSTLSNVGTRFSTITPRHSVKLWTNYRLVGELNKFRIGGGVQWQSKTSMTLSNGGILEQDSYSVVGIQAGYKVSNNTDVMLSVNNLLDKRYYERLRSTWGYNYYGEPRNYNLTFRSKF